MYITSNRGPDSPTVATGEGSTESEPSQRRVSSNVVALGSVSMVTDISSEMITAILPMYLMFGLGLNPLEFGALNGIYFGVTAFVRLAGGHAADRWQRHKLVAGTGYGLSAIAKLGLLAAGSSVPLLGAVIAVDRTGKGIRTAPRDALISLSSAPESLGKSFGVHRAMDTVGAFIGPLVAFVILAVNPSRYDSVFVVSFGVATFGVLLLILLVRGRRTTPSTGKSISLRAAFSLLAQKNFRRVCIAATLLATVALSDSFVYLLIQERLQLSAEFFPLLTLGTTGIFLILAVPLGQLADRIGRLRVFVFGYGALLCAYLLLLGPFGGVVLLVATLALHGVFYAATDGVLMAAAGPMLPPELRASGMALIQTGQAVAMMVSSVLFGTAWLLWGTPVAITIAIAALVGSIVVAVLILPLRTERQE